MKMHKRFNPSIMRLKINFDRFDFKIDLIFRPKNTQQKPDAKDIKLLVRTIVDRSKILLSLPTKNNPSSVNTFITAFGFIN